MNVVIILLGVSLMIAIGFLIAFIWSVKNGQFEDDYTPSVRMLFDDKPKKSENENGYESEKSLLPHTHSHTDINTNTKNKIKETECERESEGEEPSPHFPLPTNL